jgi:hypothetical protein
VMISRTTSHVHVRMSEWAVTERSMLNPAQNFNLIASAHFRIDQITASFVLRHSWAC